MKFGLNGRLVPKLLSGELKCFVWSALYDSCMMPGVHSMWGHGQMKCERSWNELFESNACEPMHATTVCEMNASLEARQKCWNPDSVRLTFTPVADVHSMFVKDLVQCNSGSFNSMTFHGWQMMCVTCCKSFRTTFRATLAILTM